MDQPHQKLRMLLSFSTNRVLLTGYIHLKIKLNIRILVCFQRDTVKAAQEFAKRNQLPPRVQDQVLSHICLKFRTEALKQDETLNGLPKAIRTSIAHHLFFPIVQNVRLFQGVSPNLLFQLVIFSHSFSLVLFPDICILTVWFLNSLR